MKDFGRALRHDWSARGVGYNPRVSEESLCEFEARHGVRLPADLRGYFAVVDGMNAWTDQNLFGWDEDLFRFWPLSEVTRVSDQYHPDRVLEDQDSYLLFADHSIRLPSYAIRLASDGDPGHSIVAITCHGGKYESIVVAGSFGSFAERYLAGPESRMELGAGMSPSPLPVWADETNQQRRAGLAHPLWDEDLDG